MEGYSSDAPPVKQMLEAEAPPDLLRFSIALQALEAIAAGRVDDPQAEAHEALRKLGHVPALARFHEPLARAISNSLESQASTPELRCDTVTMVRTTSRQVVAPEAATTGLLRTTSRLVAKDAAASAQTLSLEVFSAEEGISKTVGNVRPGETLASMIDKIRDEFLVPGDSELKLTLGQHLFTQDELVKRLDTLGIVDGSNLGFSLSEVQPFTVTVIELDGNSVEIEGLLPDMNLASLLNAVEQELGFTGDEILRLMLNDYLTSGTDNSKRLDALGIGPGAVLTCTRDIQAKGTCPLCRRDYRVQRGVTIGAIHDSWGRKWNKCNYNCTQCGLDIRPGLQVNVCQSCKCFWHISCRRDGM